MRCRRLYSDESGKRTVVWFGSYGKNDDGTAKFFNPDNKHDNFSDGKEAVVDSLTQRLSIIRNELWYNMSYGVALFFEDKLTTSLIVDASITSIILSHPDVDSILDFSSTVTNHHYSCKAVILSKYGVFDVNV